jgi:superoxide dismutase
MEIHHDKHHGAYVTNLNKADGHADLQAKSIDDLLKNLDSIPENILVRFATMAAATGTTHALGR